MADDVQGTDSFIAELLEGPRLGRRLSEHGEAARAALIALARAARSFTLYDPGNKVVRDLIGKYRDAIDSCVGVHGSTALTVQAYALELDEERVYEEDDREKSLSFKLFRDGVRGMVIHPEVPWEELERLLEVLSIRYTGIRQQEEDIVTLLRKAEFTRIELDIVEGVTPAEEDPEGTVEGGKTRGGGAGGNPIRPPDGWDLPVPRLEGDVPIAYRSVDPDRLVAMCAEEKGEGLLVAAVRSVEEVMRLALDTGEAMTPEEVLPYAAEVAEYLAVEGHPDLLHKVLMVTTKAYPGHADTARLLQRVSGSAAWGRLIGSADLPEEELPTLAELMGIVPGEHVDRLLHDLQTEPDVAVRARLGQIVLHLAETRSEALLERIDAVPSDVAIGLMAQLAEADAARHLETAFQLARSEYPDSQKAAIRVLRAAPGSARLATTLKALFTSGDVEVRVLAARLYASRAREHAFDPLRRLLEDRAEAGMDEREAHNLGHALASAAPDRALETFREWLKPRGLLSRLRSAFPDSPAQRLRRWAAVSGLGRIGTPEARELALRAAQKTDPTFEEHCEATVAQIDQRRRAKARG